MAGYVFLCTMAAIGTLCVLWTLAGWLLPRGKGMAAVCLGEPDVGILSRYRWLHSMGFLHSPLLVVTGEPVCCQQNRDVEVCSPEDLILRLEQEWNQNNGTGNGDPSGRHQRRGISEL